MVVVTGEEWQHSRISKVLFGCNWRGEPVVESYQKTFIQVAARRLLIKYVLCQSFGHLVDVEIPNLLAPDVENGLGIQAGNRCAAHMLDIRSESTEYAGDRPTLRLPQLLPGTRVLFNHHIAPLDA